LDLFYKYTLDLKDIQLSTEVPLYIFYNNLYTITIIFFVWKVRVLQNFLIIYNFKAKWIKFKEEEINFTCIDSYSSIILIASTILSYTQHSYPQTYNIIDT
jgi:hypothetical protein